MDIREICAEKIRAASDRARYRDFYDLALLMAGFKLNWRQVRDLISQKEIRKPITQSSIIENWHLARQEKKEEQQRIYYSQDVADSAIEEIIAKLVKQKRATGQAVKVEKE